jgi:CheY-like chemotaxis protein
MDLSSTIAPHLPFLRRFSRALTGTQQSGDAYVAAVLELIIADPASVKSESDIRLALYRHYCRIWQSVPLNMKSSKTGEPFGTMPRQIADVISPKAREAILLYAVEGFGVDEIGLILDCGAEQVSLLLAESASSTARQMATDVLVIEDEPIIAMDIEDILNSLGHRVTGIARTESQALELAARKRPGLILADIQLADGSSGLDAVAKILQQISVPVIFITAFPESVLTGERPEPAFLISKPYLPDMVKAVIGQALRFHAEAKEAA